MLPQAPETAGGGTVGKAGRGCSSTCSLIEAGEGNASLFMSVPAVPRLECRMQAKTPHLSAFYAWPGDEGGLWAGTVQARVCWRRLHTFLLLLSELLPAAPLCPRGELSKPAGPKCCRGDKSSLFVLLRVPGRGWSSGWGSLSCREGL